MSASQPGIFAPQPPAAMYLFFDIDQKTSLKAVLERVAKQVDGKQLILGIGPTVTHALKSRITVPDFPSYASYPYGTPSTPGGLWLWLRGTDRGALLHEALKLEQLLAPAFSLSKAVDAYTYGNHQDLTHYLDGTANPTEDDIIKCAVTDNGVAGIAGGSLVAVQQWQHLFDKIRPKTEAEMDDIIGRKISTNEEFDAPDDSHVSRSDQEGFDEPADIWRRSMPWSSGVKGGLMYVAFGKCETAYNLQMRRMAGYEDGLVDRLFDISKPLNGCFYWCPPMTKEGQLDLQALSPTS